MDKDSLGIFHFNISVWKILSVLLIKSLVIYIQLSRGIFCSNSEGFSIINVTFLLIGKYSLDHFLEKKV